MKLKKSIIASLVGLLFVSCSQQDAMVNELESDSQFANPLEYVGILHNKALDEIKNSQIEVDNLCDFAHSYVETSFSYEGMEAEHMSNFTEKSLLLAKEIGYERYSSYYTRGESASETADSVYKELPEACRFFVDKINEIIKNGEIDEEKISKQFSQIDFQIQVAPNLTEDEKYGLWACSAIAHSSYLYNLNDIKTRAVTAEGVVTADLEGAVGSFLCWKFWGKTAVGLMFGPQGAVVAATKEIVKGAIVSSGINVVKGLIW